MLSHRVQYKLQDFWQSARPWVFSAVGVGLLAGLWFVLANTGPGRAVEEVPDELVALDDPELLKRIEEVTVLETRYKTYAAADIVSDEAVGVLSEAVEKQRAIARSSIHGTYEQQTQLERLESELGLLRAKRTVGMILQRISDGEADVKGMRLADAEEAYKEALELQRAINIGSAPSRYKNYVREAEIEKALQSLQVFPLHFEKEAALEKARTAMTEERWADALAAYMVARDALMRINRDFANTRFADTSGLDRTEAEIASLNAASIAKELDAKEAMGDAYERAGDHKTAGDYYAEAFTRQQQINQLYARSRFMSSTRMEAIDSKLQTARSYPLATELTKLEESISADLRRRRIVAVEQALPQAMALTDRLATEFPRSRYVDGSIRIKLSYLGLKRTDLKRLQDEVFDKLLPMVGVTDRLLLGCEVPQGLYLSVMNTNPSRNPGRTMPVDSVNWNDAEEFCMRLGWILGVKVRLPTVEEYRLALGEGGGEIRSSAGDGKVGTVDGGRPNANGYRDLLGNLAEWISSPADTDRAPVAGGSNLDTPEAITKFLVESRTKVDRARHIGFRFVVDLPAER
ncbi:MAG: SUMF1/EgtB/PvdO family nonheme iron enzyme [Burkholderiales bacterium]|nr:SUMF1/EgtB/PvdO family nonheme iron enzyme [Opitutaceae bacterium]